MTGEVDDGENETKSVNVGESVAGEQRNRSGVAGKLAETAPKVSETSVSSRRVDR